ncbi:unnamed protein product [Mytilus coruscus]|uniref:Uncharacterized protein n=1 Tax=Mytilus coruscus TaxID=42192 RepID=A0A6J8CNL7_MYTCO|nr:unnamed protein product [Mytilus coruscus]
MKEQLPHITEIMLRSDSAVKVAWVYTAFENNVCNKKEFNYLLLQEAFKVPSTSTGKRKQFAKNDLLGEASPVNNNESIQDDTNTDSGLFFYPKVGCVRKFITYQGLENHILYGKHAIQLEKKTTYDTIKEQWASLCNVIVVIICKKLSSPNSSVENTLNC